MVRESCIECGGEIRILDENLIGEILSCPECGKDYVIEKNKNGGKIIIELDLEGQDFGE